MARKVRTVEIQCGITVKVPRSGQVTPRLLQQAIRHRIVEGVDPEGITIDFLIWRRAGREYHYEDDRLPDALLRATRLVPASQWVFQQVRRA